MELKHKTRVLFSETAKIGTGINGLFIFHTNLDHLGKTNHKVIGNFSVSQPNPQMVHDIIFYFLNNIQFIEWFLDTVQYTGTFRNPKKVIQSTNQVSAGSIEHIINSGGEMLFVFNNRYSTVTSKEVNVHIIEEWDEIISETDVVKTQPVEVNIEGKGISFDFGDNSLLWLIGIVNVVLILLIIIVAVKLSRK